MAYVKWKKSQIISTRIYRMCRSVHGSADSVSDMLCEMMTSNDAGWVDILAGVGIVVASDTGQVQVEHCSV